MVLLDKAHCYLNPCFCGGDTAGEVAIFDRVISFLLKALAMVSTIFLAFGLASQFLTDRAFFTHKLSLGEILIALFGLAMAWVIALSYMPFSRILSGNPPDPN